VTVLGLEEHAVLYEKIEFVKYKDDVFLLWHIARSLFNDNESGNAATLAIKVS